MIQPATSKPVTASPRALLGALALLALLATGHPGSALAQSGQGNLETARELINSGTRELIDDELDMSKREAEAFWAVYERFDMEMDLLGDQYVRLLETYMDGYLRGVLTDSDARRIIDEYLTLQIGMLRVRQKYFPEFTEALGAMKAARLYQLQNKVKAQVDAALADVVPLIELVQ